MATNELGHRLAQSVGDETTLGAYRRGRRLPWVTGATIDAWVPCARGEISTGVAPPHALFVQTLGGSGAASGSIYCPSCRAELAERRAGAAAAPLTVPAATPAAVPAEAVAAKPCAPTLAAVLDLPF